MNTKLFYICYGLYTALAMEITLVYFKGEVSPYGWAKVPAYPF
jgi:hypothetical protein